MGQSYEGYIHALVRDACVQGKAVDTGELATVVLETFPDLDRRLVIDCILAEVGIMAARR
jgi:hypothetical protein